MQVACGKLLTNIIELRYNKDMEAETSASDMHETDCLNVNGFCWPCYSKSETTEVSNDGQEAA